MSTLSVSPWNQYCWKDESISFDFTELTKMYNEVFSKYTRHRQSSFYSGIGFQGLSETDHLTACWQGTLIGKEINNIWQTVPQDKIDEHLYRQRTTLNKKHFELCKGEFEKIVDYLESAGWHTFRARIMEVNPGVQSGGWHLDGYEGSTRYHVPLQTNDECYLQWVDGNNEIKSFHLPADGSGYWLNTDVVHQYINLGSSMRAHIIVDLVKK